MGFFKLNKSPSSTLLSRFVFIIIAVWLIIINLQLNAVFATNYGRHHIHHHRLPHNCHHGRSMSSWHSIPPTSSWSDISTDSNRFTSLQHQEYSPINMDYTMETNLDQENEQSFIREEDLIKSSLNNEEKNIFIPYSFPTASWNDHQPNIYHIKKIKKRRKKKKPTKKVYYPELENPITNNDGQINRIVFIEEPENEHVKFNDAIEPIVEKQIIKTIIGQENINNLNSNFNSIQSQFQPQSQETPLIRPKITVSDEYTSKPIVTIKDLHEKLNQTLLYRIPDTDNKLGYDIQSNITNGILMIPSNLNKKIQPQQLMKTANYGNNNYFVKSNNFSFENSWNYVTSTESSNNIDYKLNDNNKNNNNKTNEQLVPSDSTNRQWLSSTIPSVVYFTSQRTIPQLQFNSVVTKPTISTTTHRNKIKNNDILEYSPRRNSAQTDKRGIGNVNVADVSMQKIASIIFAICISLMLFSCKKIISILLNLI